MSAILLGSMVWLNINKNEIREEKLSSLFVENIEQFASSSKETSLWFDEFYLDGMKVIYDKQDNVFFASIRNANEVKDLIISWNSRNTNVVLEEKEINDELLFNNDGIRMLIYDKDRWFESKLIFTTLPIININKFDSKVNSNYDDCFFEIMDANDNSLYVTYDGKVRIRGAATTEFDKPGLRLKLNSVLKGDNNTEQKYYELFGLYPDNEYVVYTSNVEKNNIRNVFSTNLWFETCSKDNQFGTDTGIQYRYVEIFINNQYWGLCAVGNSINKRILEVDTKINSDKYPYENIYKANYYGERKYMDIEKYNSYGSFAKLTNEGNPESWKPLEDYMKVLLYNQDVKTFYYSVDLDNALDTYLYLNLIQGWDNAYFDGGCKFRNMYLISKYNDKGQLKFMYVPWDLDRTWGHEVEPDNNYSMDFTYNYDMIMNPIENLLSMNDQQIIYLVNKKYNELRNNLWSDENLLRILNEYEKQLYGSGAYQRDRNRWPQNPHVDENNLKEFKDYVIQRITYFDEYVKDGLCNNKKIEN